MLSEMAEFYSLYHDIITPADVVRMATLDAADFLGLAGRFGEISPGASSALAYAPFNGKTDDVLEFLITDGQSKVKAVKY